MVHLNKGDLKPALDDANAAIKLDPKWIKGHYRKGMALEKMKKWGEAYDSLKVAAEARRSRQTNHANRRPAPPLSTTTAHACPFC